MHGPRDLTVDGCAKPGSGAGRFCCELIKLGIREEKIAELARERFGGKTSVHCVRCYASKMRPRKLPNPPLFTRRASASGVASHSSSLSGRHGFPP